MARLQAFGFTVETVNQGGREQLWARRGKAAPLVLLRRPHRCGTHLAPWNNGAAIPSCRWNATASSMAAGGDMKGSIAAWLPPSRIPAEHPSTPVPSLADHLR